MSNDDKKLEGQRAAIREHINKHRSYPEPEDKAFALKTIGNAQDQITAILKKHPHWDESWEDRWRPPR